MGVEADDLLIFQKRKPGTATVTAEKPNEIAGAKTSPKEEPVVVKDELPATNSMIKGIRFPAMKPAAQAASQAKPLPTAPVASPKSRFEELTPQPQLQAQPAPRVMTPEMPKVLLKSEVPPKPSEVNEKAPAPQPQPRLLKEDDYIKRLAARAEQELSAQHQKEKEEVEAARKTQAAMLSLQKAQAQTPPATRGKGSAPAETYVYQGNYNRTGQDNINAAVGQSCAYHPWREAYATCQICQRPFCFADIVKYKSNFYCLEDIDNITSKAHVKELTTGINVFQILAGLVTINVVVYLGYYALPSVTAMYQYITTIGFSAFITSVVSATFKYYLPLANASIIILSLISAFLIFTRSNKGFYFSVFVVLFTIVIVGYEFVNSDQQFLFYTSAIALIDLALLAYSRLSATAQARAEERTATVNFPRLESF
jgi:hypothetical protein